MAAFNIMVWDTAKNRSSSKSSTDTVFDFQSLRIGASNLQISDVGGNFDFDGKILANIGAPTADSHAVNKLFLDTALANIDLTPYLKRDGTTTLTGTLNPATTNTTDLGSSATVFRRMYSGQFRGLQFTGNGANTGPSSNALFGTRASSEVNAASGTVTVTSGTSDSVADSGDGLGSGATGDVIIATGITAGARGKVVLNGSTIDASSKVIENVATPTLGHHAANKDYVDSASSNGANKTLSNLTGPTSINADLIPQGDGTYNLGTVANKYSLLHAYGVRGLNAPAIGSDATNKTYVDGAIATAVTGLATQAYVNAVVQGLDPKAGVRAATTTDLDATYANGTDGVGATLTMNAVGALVIDGVSVAVGDRVLVKDQASAVGNGIYNLTTLGDGSTAAVLTRSTDADTCQPAANPKVTAGMYMFAFEGTENGGSSFVLQTNDPITLGTTALIFDTFQQVMYTAGDGISITGSVISADYVKSFVNNSGSAISDLKVVFINENQGAILAGAAQTDANLYDVGIVKTGAADGVAMPVYYRHGAIVTITGATFTPGEEVYVSDTPGELTQDTSGFSAGFHVYCVGRAMSATQVKLDPSYKILVG